MNAEFFAGQDIRRTQATAAENRLSTRLAGEETRATIGTHLGQRRSCYGCRHKVLNIEED